MLAHRASERASGVAGMREWGYRGFVKVVGPALAMESGVGLVVWEEGLVSVGAHGS